MNESGDWIPFRYREFYDFPRTIILKYKSYWYFLECLFSNAFDEYEDIYTVYKLTVGDTEAEKMTNKLDWSEFAGKGEVFGKISVHDIQFDSTRRGKLNSNFLDLIC